jgi:hypothetical protein
MYLPKNSGSVQYRFLAFDENLYDFLQFTLEGFYKRHFINYSFLKRIFHKIRKQFHIFCWNSAGETYLIKNVGQFEI